MNNSKLKNEIAECINQLDEDFFSSKELSDCIRKKYDKLKLSYPPYIKYGEIGRYILTYKLATQVTKKTWQKLKPINLASEVINQTTQSERLLPVNIKLAIEILSNMNSKYDLIIAKSYINKELEQYGNKDEAIGS